MTAGLGLGTRKCFKLVQLGARTFAHLHLLLLLLLLLLFAAQMR